MSSGTFGMDHRAIVWCHGILERVRELIWELMRANSGTSSADDVTITVTTTTVVERVLGITAYKKDMMELESRAVVRRRFSIGSHHHRHTRGGGGGVKTSVTMSENANLICFFVIFYFLP